jgi:hypothetical protein
VDFYVSTAGNAGSGLLFGIYSADLSRALCVSTVATGTTVTTTGGKSITWASGSAVSGGICTLVAGGGYRWVQTTDSRGIRLLTYGDPYFFVATNIRSANRAGYDATGSLSTGTGTGLAFATPSGVTLTGFSDASTNFRPVIALEN